MGGFLSANVLSGPGSTLNTTLSSIAACPDGHFSAGVFVRRLCFGLIRDMLFRRIHPLKARDISGGLRDELCESMSESFSPPPSPFHSPMMDFCSALLVIVLAVVKATF